MKVKKIALTALAAAWCCGVLPGHAADPVDVQYEKLLDDHRVVSFGTGPDAHTDSVRAMLDAFYLDQFRNFQDPAAPYFLFMSRDAKLAMGIGGMVKVRGMFDWGNVVPGGDFMPSDVPMSPDPLMRERWLTSPSGSGLFFRVIGKNSKIGTYQLYLEANFTGYGGRDFHLKKAYATINDWTIGYASSTFGDGAAEAPTIDANGSTMSMSGTNVLIRYMHHFVKSGLYVGASVETPSMNLQTVEGKSAARSTYVPNFAAMVQYEWAKGQHIRLSGIMRFLPYRNLVTGRAHQSVGYGVQFSTVARPVAPLTFYGIVNGGSSYINSSDNFLLGEYDMLPCAHEEGKLCTVPMLSYFLGVRYNFSSDVYASGTFGQGRYYPCCVADRSDYKYGLYTALNLFWEMTPRIRVGAGAGWTKRVNFDGDHAWGHRICAMAQFSF